MKNNKGFTLVELVIVIAVIAILAGVSVGTFANIINAANESANLHKYKSAIDEIKATDILDEIDNNDWYSINDFESKVAEQLAKLFVAAVDVDTNIEEYLQTAIYEYEDNLNKSNLTDDDLVIALINNSVNKPSFGGVTYYQAKAIVDEIYKDTIEASTKKTIINNGVNKQLTAYDFAKYVNDNKETLKTNQNINASHKDNNYTFNFDFNINPNTQNDIDIINLADNEKNYWGNTSTDTFHYKVKSVEDLCEILNSYNNGTFSFGDGEKNYNGYNTLKVHIMNSLDISSIDMELPSLGHKNSIIIKETDKDLIIIGFGETKTISTSQDVCVRLFGFSKNKQITFDNLHFITYLNNSSSYTIFCPNAIGATTGDFIFKNCIIEGQPNGVGIKLNMGNVSKINTEIRNVGTNVSYSNSQFYKDYDI